MILLTKDQIILLHEQLINETGGSHGLRDEGLLESALSAPFQMFAEVEAFPTVLEKAARLGYGLIQNHAFIDGNKRIGAHGMLVFLAINGIYPSYTQDELVSVILNIAAGNMIYADLLHWLQSHIE